MTNDMGAKIVTATKWSSVTEIGTKLITPIINMMLARLLTPGDFGVIATITMIVSFAEIFAESGCPKYLVQHEFKDDKDLDESTNVAFWTNLAISLIMWLLIYLFAEPLIGIVGSAGHEAAVIVMGVQIPLLSIVNIQMARFRRVFDFKSLFYARVTTALIPLVVTIPMALMLKSYWALVWGTLIRDVVNVIVLSKLSNWKPRWAYSFQKLKDMISFTAWTIFENVSIWLTMYAGTFIVGSFLSTHYLGLYKNTITTVNSYMTIITAVTTPVLFSALSRYQDDNEMFASIYLKFQRMVSLLVFPLGFGLLMYRELATFILLGDQWMETADFLGLLSLSSAVVIVFSHFNSEFIRSKGKPQLSVLVQFLHIVVLWPVLYWAAQQNYAALGIANCIVKLEIIVAGWFVVRYFFGFGVIRVLRNVWAPFVAALSMAMLAQLLLCISRNYVWQFVSIVLCAIFYFSILYVIPSGRRLIQEIPILNKHISNR